MADTIGKDGNCGATPRKPLVMFGILSLYEAVVCGAVPNKTTTVRALEIVKVNPRMLNSLIGDLKNSSLSAIHVDGLEVAYTEKGIVKISGVMIEIIAILHLQNPGAMSFGEVGAIDVETRAWDDAVEGSLLVSSRVAGAFSIEEWD